MKKVLLNILLLAAFFFIKDGMAQTPQWSNWSKFPSCFLGFEFRIKAIGFNKYVNKYEWVAQVKNNYGIKATFNMSWTVDGEKQSIGQFTVSNGETTNAATHYFNSAAGNLYVEVGDVCFGDDKWCECKAACDARPGVPNQLSKEACNGLTSPPKNTSNNTGYSTNTTRTTTNTYSNNTNVNNSDKTIKDPLAERDFKKYPFDADECRRLFPQGHPSPESGDCIWLNCPCTDHLGNSNTAFKTGNQTNSTQSIYQGYVNQYNEAQIQNTINSIQNTPINTFEVGKLEIKNVKRQPASGTGVDKGSVSSISGLDKIEMEFPELAKKKDDDIFYHAKGFPTTEKAILLLRNAIDWQHPETGGKMDFDLTIDEKGTVIGVSVLSEPRKKELEDKVSSHILRNPLVFYHTAAERNGNKVRDNISYSISYASSAELDKEKIQKWQSEDAKKNTSSITLANGGQYQLEEGEQVIEADKVNMISWYSPESIKSKFNEFKNSIKDKIQYLKDTDLITMFQDANKSNEKTNAPGGASSSQSVQYAIINGRLCSVKRLDSKTTAYRYVE